MKDEVLKYFGFLFEKFGFSLCESNPQMGYVIGKSNLMNVRFIKDRADFFVDLSNSDNPSNWRSMFIILEEMKSKGISIEDYKITNRIGAQSSILEKNFHTLCNYLK